MKVEGVVSTMQCTNGQQPIGHAVCVLFSVVQTIVHRSLLDMLCVYSVVTCTTEYTGM